MNPKRNVLRVASSLCEFLWPGSCAGCRRSAPHGPLCAACEFGLPRRPNGTEVLEDGLFVFAPFRYEALARELLVRGKYGHDATVFPALVHALTRSLPSAEDLGAPSIVVPIPTTWWRRSRRGVDPALVFAEAVAAELRLPCRLWLARRRAPRQATLRGKERRRNLKDAFIAGPVRHQRVLLVDDVVTTGTTLREAARALIVSGGADDVVAIACCRVDGPSSIW